MDIKYRYMPTLFHECWGMTPASSYQFCESKMHVYFCTKVHDHICPKFIPDLNFDGQFLSWIWVMSPASSVQEQREHKSRQTEKWIFVFDWNYFHVCRWNVHWRVTRCRWSRTLYKRTLAADATHVCWAGTRRPTARNTNTSLSTATIKSASTLFSFFFQRCFVFV